MGKKIDMSRQAKNIATLRGEAKLTQKAFAVMMSELMNRDIPFTIATISSWETGKRSPTLDVIEKMSELFGVSTDFIMGKTSVRNGEYTIDIAENQLASEQISFTRLTAYNKLPVYVTFPDLSHPDGWGIVDISDNTITIVMPGRTLEITQESNYKIYPRDVNSILISIDESHNPLGMSQITNSNHKQFWVELNSTDKEQRRYFNGWYKLTPNKEYLVKDNKLILSLSGLNVQFRVYAEKPENE